MRELKFRVWWKNHSEPTIYTEYDFFDDTWTVEEYIAIEQYTGLKDKNGKEIYEGDIVSEEFAYRDENVKTIWQVRWCDCECAFELHYVGGFELDDSSLDADEEDYDVIGNIHENPELLEVKNVD